MQLILSRISHPASSNLHAASIQNIIFDFGGVICNIDVSLTEMAFKYLGLKAFDKKSSITDSKGLFENLETGSISPVQFRNEVRKIFDKPITDEQINNAWNAMLLDIPAARINLLEDLQLNYRTFLLSNSNAIHYQKYLADFNQNYGYTNFDELFEKAWFSFNIGLKKPDTAIFRFVTNQSGLNPAETLFIDDTLMHVEGANKAGLHAHHLKITQKEEITDLFE
jgi:putative hydrolase of the HAD superfamily